MKRTAKADRLYADPRGRVGDFDFGADTARVFNDMLERSVPFYREIQRMIGEITADFAVSGTNVYDLGCSTCTTFRALDGLAQDVTFVGVDDSEAMLERADTELKRAGFDRPYRLQRADLHEGAAIDNASVVIMSLTLQFVRPLARKRLAQRIYDGLNPQGCLILIEKVLAEQTLLNRLFIDHYYDFKRRNGYSDLEIAQKREALENVLVPFRLEENRELLASVGFSTIEVFFKWYNFCGLVALR